MIEALSNALDEFRVGEHLYIENRVGLYIYLIKTRDHVCNFFLRSFTVSNA